jgi:hypothetical protein
MMMVMIQVTDYGREDPICIPDDLHGRRTDRVWYAEVKLLLKVFCNPSDDSEGRVIDLAFIQWYENFGVSVGADKRVHKDPNFPSALAQYFPRIYLTEPRLKPSFDVIEVSKIIAPAPISDDVSLLADAPASTIRRRRGKARTGQKGKRGKKSAEQPVCPQSCHLCPATFSFLPV